MRAVRLPLLIGAVLALGTVLVAGAVARTAAAPAAGILVICAASFASGLLIVELSSVSAESITFALVAAAAFEFGVWGAVAAAIAGEIGSALAPPRPRAYRSAYNVAAHALAAAAFAIVVRSVAPSGRVGLASAAVAVPGSLLYFGVSSALVALAIAWSHGWGIAAVWKREFRWLAPHYPALTLAGAVLARGYEATGTLGVLIFCLPLVMSHYSVNIFVRRTREQMEALERANTRLESINNELTQTLASVVDARDLYLFRHSHRASLYTERIARHLALPEEEVQLAKQGALLHDIGKVGIPEAILRKPSPLDDAERSIMNSHSEIGAEIVARTRELQHVAAIVRAHHERFDGAGYPDGLKGGQIPIGARIVAVLEAFDAMISDRPYRAGMAIDAALVEVERCAGTQFDPAVVRAFFEVIREQGSDWFSNSAAGAEDSGSDLFLPKAARTHDDHHHEEESDVGRTLRLVR